MYTMEDWVTIRNMKHRNPKMGSRAIAKALGISRNTVINALRAEEPTQYKRKEYMNPEIKPFKKYIKKQYIQKKLKGSRILNDLHAKGCKVSRSALYRYLAKLDNKTQKAYMRYETKPGEQGQFDWSPYSVMLDGCLTKVQVFCTILGCSRYRIYTASLSQTQASVLEAMENGYIAIGGVPERTQTDNHSTLYDSKRDRWNPRYLRFAEHYGFQPSRSAVRHPWSKGKVENPFSYLENHFIMDNEYESFEDFCNKLAEFNVQVNRRVHTTTQVEPEKLYLEEEKDALLPLPTTRFVGPKEEFRKVSSDCLISYKGNRYSVPHVFVSKEVWVFVSQGRYLNIYSTSNKLIATHILEKKGKGKIFLNKEHFQGYRGTKGTWKFLCHQFLEKCPDHGVFLDKLRAQKRINPARHLTKIVEAIKYFTRDDAERVIRLCDEYNVYNSEIFVKLLHKESQPLSVPNLCEERLIDIRSPDGVIRSLGSYRTTQYTLEDNFSGEK